MLPDSPKADRAWRALMAHQAAEAEVTRAAIRAVAYRDLRGPLAIGAIGAAVAGIAEAGNGGSAALLVVLFVTSAWFVVCTVWAHKRYRAGLADVAKRKNDADDARRYADQAREEAQRCND